MKVAIFGKEFRSSFTESITLLFSLLDACDAQIFVYKPFYDFLMTSAKLHPKVRGFFDKGDWLSADFDFMLSVGGDGTFLEAIRYIHHREIPLVGINTGRLGFLAYISPDEIPVVVAAMVEGNFAVEKRELIDLKSDAAFFGDFNFALNELTVLKKDTSAMITIHVFLDHVFLNSYWADGLIIATPTGSTAYSLSAGGPIVAPNSQNFVITPLAPHNLTVRPLVVPNDKVITIKVTGRTDSFLATLDDRSVIIDAGVELRVAKADFEIGLFRMEHHNFFGTLRNKLMWGVDKRN